MVRALLVFVMVLTVAACQFRVPPKPQCDFLALQDAVPSQGPVLVPQAPGSVTPMPLNAVNITDVAIINKIMVQSNNATRATDGDIDVFARFVNCTDYPLQIEARAHFLDSMQVDAEPVTAWSRIYLPARSLGSYSVRSTAGTAVESYLIELREGR